MPTFLAIVYLPGRVIARPLAITSSHRLPCDRLELLHIDGLVARESRCRLCARRKNFDNSGRLNVRARFVGILRSDYQTITGDDGRYEGGQNNGRSHGIAGQVLALRSGFSSEWIEREIESLELECLFWFQCSNCVCDIEQTSWCNASGNAWSGPFLISMY